MKNCNDFLLDCFYAQGDNEDEFEDLVRWIDDHTHYVKRPLKDLVILSIRDPKKAAEGETMGVWYLDPAAPINTETGKLRVSSLNKKKLFGANMNAALLKESLICNPTCVLDREGKGVLFLSPDAYETFAQRLGVNKSVFEKPGLVRDMFVADRMNNGGGCTLVVKSYRKTGKIFAMMGERYVDIKLHEICVLYKDLMGESKLGNMVCEGWEVCHESVRIRFRFPEYAEDVSRVYNLPRTLVPCVELSTSDTGEKSFTVMGCWRTSNGTLIYDQVLKKEHREKLNTDRIEREVNEKIFSKYNILPERLVELMMIPVTPPGLDLTKKRAQTKNHKEVLRAFKYIFRKIRLVSILSKTLVSKLEKIVDYTVISDETEYTMYDVVMDVFNFMETIEEQVHEYKLCADTLEKAHIAVSTAAYVDFGEEWPAETAAERREVG